MTYLLSTGMRRNDNIIIILFRQNIQYTHDCSVVRHIDDGFFAGYIYIY